MFLAGCCEGCGFSGVAGKDADTTLVARTAAGSRLSHRLHSVGSEAHSPSSLKLQGWFNTFSVEDSKKFYDANDHLI
jgi:hypothetical protein